MRVIISGAGIAGPTLAWWLAKGGVHVTIIERANEFLPYGQNVDIEGTAVSVIEKMGLMAEVRRNNTTEKGTRFIDPSGRPFAAMPVREGYSLSPTSVNEILRGDLAAVLYRATKDLPNIDYLLGTTIQGTVIQDDNSVKVDLSNGAQLSADVLVAADGQWSRLRKQCLPSDYLGVADKNMYCVYWTSPRTAADSDHWNIFQALNSRTITLRPDPYGTIRSMFTCVPRNPTQKAAWQHASKAGREAQEALARKEFADVQWEAPRLLSVMSKAKDFYFQAVQQIVLSQWWAGRVVCVGDAAYAPTPLSGMGTSLAIAGAYVLAGELVQLGAGEDPSKAFAAYEKAFRPAIEEAQPPPNWVPALVHPQTAWGRWCFQVVVSGLTTVIAGIAAVPWVAGRYFSSQGHAAPLPYYPVFDGVGGK